MLLHYFKSNCCRFHNRPQSTIKFVVLKKSTQWFNWRRSSRTLMRLLVFAKWGQTQSRRCVLHRLSAYQPTLSQLVAMLCLRPQLSTTRMKKKTVIWTFIPVVPQFDANCSSECAAVTHDALLHHEFHQRAALTNVWEKRTSFHANENWKPW